jgi:hypothetical protein
VIYNHDPLSAYAVVQKTLIDGKVYFDRAKDLAGRPALEKEKKDLLEKEKKASEANKPDHGKKMEGKPEEKPKPPSADSMGDMTELNTSADSQVVSGGAQ